MKPAIHWLYAVVALLLAGAGAYGVWSYQHMATRVAELSPLKDQVTALRDQIDQLSQEMVKRAEFDSAIRSARQGITSNLDKVAHENPSARAYLGERIPDGVRAAYLAPVPERHPSAAADAH